MKKVYETPTLDLLYLEYEDILTLSSREIEEDDDVITNGKFGDFEIFY